MRGRGLPESSIVAHFGGSLEEEFRDTFLGGSQRKRRQQASSRKNIDRKWSGLGTEGKPVPKTPTRPTCRLRMVLSLSPLTHGNPNRSWPSWMTGAVKPRTQLIWINQLPD